MKNCLKVVAVIILIALGFSGCENSSSPSTSVNNRVIVCFGDSLTEGYGAAAQDEIDKLNSYPAFLEKKVSLPVVNAGITGNTTAQGLDRLKKDVLSEKPQVVIILLGANDFMQIIPPAAHTKENLKLILKKVKSKDRKVYLASFIGDSQWEAKYIEKIPELLVQKGVPDEVIASIGGGDPERFITDRLESYKKVFEDLKKENPNLKFISNIWKDIKEEHMSDPIHPNAAGYEIMANNIFRELDLADL